MLLFDKPVQQQRRVIVTLSGKFVGMRSERVPSIARDLDISGLFYSIRRDTKQRKGSEAYVASSGWSFPLMRSYAQKKLDLVRTSTSSPMLNSRGPIFRSQVFARSIYLFRPQAHRGEKQWVAHLRQLSGMGYFSQ